VLIFTHGFGGHGDIDENAPSPYHFVNQIIRSTAFFWYPGLNSARRNAWHRTTETVEPLVWLLLQTGAEGHDLTAFSRRNGD